jgi:hypothetical protein
VTKLEAMALAIFDSVNGLDGEISWERMSAEDRTTALEWGRSAQAVADDDLVRAREFFDYAAAYQSQVLNASAAYNQVIVLAGYAGYFAMWSTMSPDLPRWVVNTSGGLMVLSLTLFIGWTVISMVLGQWQIDRTRAEIDKGVVDYHQRAAAVEIEGVRVRVRINKYWLPTVVVTALLAIAATLLLSGAAFTSVINQAG